MFVFYDTETTGTNITFDQILQFAAILTDENFNEIERFEIKCQLLPWLVPSPMALVVTKTPPKQLSDPALPTFFEMMSKVRAKLDSWSPAIFMGYNSIPFDEPLLHRAFWQTLNPPYLTVTNKNSRCDILPIVRLASHFYPDSFIWPKREDGKITLKLDQLAPLNGFDHSMAHDALGDVEAIIFIAKKLKENLPDVWSALLSRTTKIKTTSLIQAQEPILVFEYIAGKPFAWFGQQVKYNDKLSSHELIARLSCNWETTAQNINENKIQKVAQKSLRSIPLNKAPTIFTIQEAKSFFNLEPSNEEIYQSDFIKQKPSKMENIIQLTNQEEKEWDKGEELEQMIYEGFPSKKDSSLANLFQKSNWQERYEIAKKFEDERYYNLALRIIYISTPELLSTEEIESINTLIESRLRPKNDEYPWRSIFNAEKELKDLVKKGLVSNNEAAILSDFLLSL